MSSSSEVIDLTNSFTLIDHCGLQNIVIELDTDDSLIIDSNCSTDMRPICSGSVANVKTTLRQTAAENTKKKSLKIKRSWSQRKGASTSPHLNSESKSKFGGCPICWDELGNNPLASTKCGHVYCMQCIQEYLKKERRCPTCRQSLKGNTAYHPLYLSRE